MVDWIERHDDDPPDTSIADGSAGGAVGAPDASVIPPTHSITSLKQGLEGRLLQRDNALIAGVSGNPLPLWHYVNIKIGNHEPTGDRQNGQTASTKHTQYAEFYPTANSPAAEEPPAGVRRHRRWLSPGTGRASASHPTAPGRHPRNPRPLPAALTKQPLLPTISELLHIAVTETDFTGDLTNDQRLLETNVENSIDLAATIWEERHNDIPVPLSLIQWARCALLLEAEAMLRDREAHAEAERLDAIEAGDIDAATGCFIPYDTYRSV